MRAGPELVSWTASLIEKLSDPRRNVCQTSPMHGGCGAFRPIYSRVTQARQEIE
jgi:hypothetical protein